MVLGILTIFFQYTIVTGFAGRTESPDGLSLKDLYIIIIVFQVLDKKALFFYRYIYPVCALGHLVFSDMEVVYSESPVGDLHGLRQNIAVYFFFCLQGDLCEQERFVEFLFTDVDPVSFPIQDDFFQRNDSE
jgi:hypothetical protein